MEDEDDEVLVKLRQRELKKSGVTAPTTPSSGSRNKHMMLREAAAQENADDDLEAQRVLVENWRKHLYAPTTMEINTYPC